MTDSEVGEYIRSAFEGVATTHAFGYEFFFYGEDRTLPFATMTAQDNEHDRVSDLDRDGVFRLNLGVNRETYIGLFGPDRPRLGENGVLAGDVDFTQLDRLLPHPHYAPQSWICVLSPSEQTFESRVKPLLREAYELAVRREQRRQKGS